jgi:hypothetical protein
MAEYPNNSHSARERTDSTAPGKAEKKLEKVVTGAAKTRKKSEARKFVNIFVPEDGENVKSYMLFGDSGRIGGSRNKRDGRSRLTYWDDRRDDRREYGRPRAAAGFEYDDIIFETRGDAELVLDQLESAIANYGIASVADLYDLAGITCRNYTANRYGWTDIQSAKVIRTREGYTLQLPRTVQIN